MTHASVAPSEVDVKRYARELRKSSEFDDEIRDFDRKSRNKVLLLNAVFVLTLAVFALAGESWWLVPVLVLVNGAFALPNLRIFIHSEAHWGLCRTAPGTWYMRFLAFAPYQIPFEAYRVGHFAHHQYDNDIPERDHTLANDRQSTYLYSQKGTPVSFVVWAVHYLFVYQYINQFVLVIKRTNRKKIATMLLQLALIIGIDAAIAAVSVRFFVAVFIPSLIIAWVGSAIVLYMMHNVRFTDAKYHHSVNSHSRFFNRFGDNDGMHVIHSLVPFLHPFHQARANELIEGHLHPDQELKSHYVTAFVTSTLRRALRGTP